MVGFQDKLNKELHGFQTYKKGQWIKYRTQHSGWQFGTFNAVKDGELILSSFMQPMPDERGEWPKIVKKEKIITVSAIYDYTKTDFSEVRHVMENYNLLQKEFGNYVLLSCSGTDYLGKVHKLFLNSDVVELLPYANYKCGEPYIERERPIRLSLSKTGTPIPRTEEDLEWRINEAKKQQQEAQKRKNGNGPSLVLPDSK